MIFNLAPYIILIMGHYISCSFLLTRCYRNDILSLVDMEEYPSLAEGIGLENRQAG